MEAIVFVLTYLVYILVLCVALVMLLLASLLAASGLAILKLKHFNNRSPS